MTILLGVTLRAQSPEKTFPINYFGYHLDLTCQVKPMAKPAKTFQDLINKNLAEVENCHAALAQVSEKFGFQDHNYGQALLFWKLAETFAGPRTAKQWVSFADAAAGKKMGRNEKIALIYALLVKAGYGARIAQDQTEYFILLQVKDKLAGIYFKSYEAYRIWEPGYPFEEIPAGKIAPSLRFPEIFNSGSPVTFNTLGAIPWSKTWKGGEVKFQSPENCPVTWNFSRERIPGYEEFLKFWPRKREIQAYLSDEILSPFNLSVKFNPGKNPEVRELRDDQFGNCLFKWVRINTPYAPGRANLRNPLETLVQDRKGDCDELSISLLAVMREAGYPPDNIRMAVWPKHMTLAVAPLREPGPDSFLIQKSNCSFPEEGKLFYVMDTSYLCKEQTPSGKIREVPENQCPIKWGMCKYEVLGGQDFISQPVENQ